MILTIRNDLSRYFDARQAKLGKLLPSSNGQGADYIGPKRITCCWNKFR